MALLMQSMQVYLLYIIFFSIYQAPRPYLQGYSSHASYKILFPILQVDDGLVGSRLLGLSVEQVDVPSRLVCYGGNDLG
jgi:hypothetical protein